MALTRLSVGKSIEISFGDREKETITESKVLLMRDGKDLETELTSRSKKPADLAFTLDRTLLGDLEVTVTKVTPTRG